MFLNSKFFIKYFILSQLCAVYKRIFYAKELITFFLLGEIIKFNTVIRFHYTGCSITRPTNLQKIKEAQMTLNQNSMQGATSPNCKLWYTAMLPVCTR